ncbi:MAG: fibronectin type III domain-containing protein, partial [Bacteroidota bacterium]
MKKERGRFSCVFLVLGFVLSASLALAYPGGVAGRTLKTSNAGCGSCHSSNANTNVVVAITGPDTLQYGQVATYTVTVNDVAGNKGGVDIASSAGSVAPISSTLKLLSGEVVHRAGTTVPSTYQFSLTAPTTGATVILYATAKGAGMNSWNWAPNKTVILRPAAPAAPVLLTPTNGATNQPTSLTLRWRSSSGATSYRVQASTDSLFATTVVDDSTVADTTKPVSGLLNSVRYFWRVAAKNGAGTSSYSSVWSFTTVVPLPSQVTLVSPSNGALVSADSARLIWRRANPSVTSYWCERAEDSLFTVSVLVDSAITDSGMVTRSLRSGRAYWWRVKAKNAAGWGPLSMARSFSVVLTGVAEGENVSAELNLYQNYPNPFNPSTGIWYS